MIRYDASSISFLSIIAGIRERPSMYLGSSDTDGIKQQFREILSNAVDESMNGYGNTIEVMVNINTHAIQISDKGRGIPFSDSNDENEVLMRMITSIHSGGKMKEGTAYNTSGGLHGCGLSAASATAEWLKIISLRPEGRGEIITRKGIPDGPTKIDKTYNWKANGTGTIVQWLPDKTIFGDDISIEQEWYEKTLRELSYLTKGIEFVLLFSNGDNVLEGYRYKSDNGIIDYLKHLNEGQTQIHKHPFYFEDERDGVRVEVALQYNTTAKERLFCFTNNIPNPQGGTHLTGVKTALTRVFNKEMEGDFTGDNLSEGRTMIISIKMREPTFGDQSKNKLTSPEARTVCSALTTDYFRDYLTLNGDDAEQILDKMNRAKKAESAAERARLATQKTLASIATKPNAIGIDVAKFTDCSSKTPPMERELIVVEGDSAAGTAKEARRKDYQAILPCFGKILNTQRSDSESILESEKIQSIIKVIGAGFGEYFNINKVRYGKIISLSDADVDGK